MKKLSILILLLSFMVQPTFSQSKKELKAEKKQEDYLKIKELINSKQYEFTGEWATSSKGKRINLMSNPTYMKIDNTTGDGFFPFFGTSFSGSGYGLGSGGIEFKNELKEYEVTFNDKKQTATIKFKVDGENDNYDVTTKVFAEGNTTIIINSNNRSVMNYSGKTKALEKKETK
ncbi:DUF4251 domain-containing protein [Lutibacter holmesii]|uniref:DUF4251 domain-containing protein n=1 Tax=Lutibacter holmesii TaxID=1137985 RepID=A0ABW3WUI2_9FLAO